MVRAADVGKFNCRIPLCVLEYVGLVDEIGRRHRGNLFLDWAAVYHYWW
jgi:hypothetical protein